MIHLYQYLTENAVVGAKNSFVLNDDGSYAGYKVPRTCIAHVARMIISIEDSGVFKAETYGALSALSSGIEVKRYSNGVLAEDLTDGVPITSNGQWGKVCYDVDLKTWGSGNSLILVRWTFARSGAPVILRGAAQDDLRVEFNDDFTGLIAHQFMIQGFVEDKDARSFQVT